MLPQTWIILIVIHLIGGTDPQSATGSTKANDAVQAQQVVSVVVPIDNDEGEEKADTKGYNILEDKASGDLYSQEGGGLGPIAQRLPEREESHLKEPGYGGQIGTRHPISNIQQDVTAMDDGMSESEEDRLELLIRNLPADQDLGAVAKSLREDKTLDEILPTLPGYNVVAPAPQNQPTQEEVGQNVHELPPNKSIGPIPTDPLDSKKIEPTNDLPQNKALVLDIQDQPTETTELEGAKGVSEEGITHSLDVTDASPVPTVDTTRTLVGAEPDKGNHPAPQQPAILNENMTANTIQKDNSTIPVQQHSPTTPTPGPSQVPNQHSEHNNDPRLINQRVNEEKGKNHPEGKNAGTTMTETMVGIPMHQRLAALRASLYQRQGAEDGNANGKFIVLGNHAKPPAHGWYFNSGYGYGGVQPGMVPQVSHQVVPRQVYGGAPQVVYGTVPVVGHGARYAPGYSLSKRPSPVQLPNIDRNGCTEPGDIVCSADLTERCSYRLCVLADENKNLWRRPLMDVTSQSCPAGRGLLSEFCNTHERLLRAMGLMKEEGGSCGQHYHPQRRYTMARDPCILINAACTGTL